MDCAVMNSNFEFFESISVCWAMDN